MKLPNGPSDKEISDKLDEVENKVFHISFIELLKDIPISHVPIEHQHNLEILLERINRVRNAYGHAMTVTSGYRTEQDQFRIYRSRGYADKDIPMGSWHLKGGACDILDATGQLMQWCRDNEALLIEIGLWMEDDPTQPRVHFQIAPPKSGNRFFKP